MQIVITWRTLKGEGGRKEKLVSVLDLVSKVDCVGDLELFPLRFLLGSLHAHDSYENGGRMHLHIPPLQRATYIRTICPKGNVSLLLLLLFFTSNPDVQWREDLRAYMYSEDICTYIRIYTQAMISRL